MLSNKNLTLAFGLFMSLVFVGLLFSFAVLSITTVLMAVFGIIYIIKNGTKHLSLLEWGVWIGILTITMLPLQDCFMAEPWWERVRVRLPFVFIGLFLSIPVQINTSKILTALTALGVILIGGHAYTWYSSLSSDISNVYGTGGALNTPGNHIRFSVITTLYSVLALYYLILNKVAFAKAKLYFLGAIVILLIVANHLLSVRTGLVLLYISGPFLLLAAYRSFSQKKLILITALASISLPIILYFAYPVFKNKLDYMAWDLSHFGTEKGHIYADSGRLTSLEIGLKVWQKHFWLGAGSSCLVQESKAIAQAHFPKYPSDLLPHNQFVFSLAHLGIIGTLLTLGLYLWLMWSYRSKPLIPLLFTFTIVWWMIDHPWEGLVGVCLSSLIFFVAKSTFFQNN